jgi:hypothetical protein
MSINWDKLGAIAGLVSIPVAAFAIFAQVATPEIRCQFSLEKNGCPDVAQSSLEEKVQPTIIALSPSPQKEEPELPQTQEPYPKTTISGEWVGTYTCSQNITGVTVKIGNCSTGGC